MRGGNFGRSRARLRPARRHLHPLRLIPQTRQRLAAQVLPQLVLPVGLTLLLAIAGLVLRRKALVILALVLLWASSTELTAGALWRVVEAGQERILTSAPQADAIVVLSSRRRTAPGDDGVRGWDTAERFLGGLELIAAERAPWLVFTGGWSPRAPSAAPEGDVNRLDAVAFGVDPERILTTDRVRNTAEEAEAVSALLREHGIGSSGTDPASMDPPHVLLVTSAYHMPRAVALHEREGLRVTPFPVDFRQDTVRRHTLLDLLPSGGALAATETALREIYGRLVYRVGW